MQPAGTLAGRRALITGAANGIGLSSAGRFVAEGAKVALLDVDAAGLDRAGRSIAGSVSYCVDVRDEDALSRAIFDAERALGGLDIVVANAGVEPRDDARADRLDTAVWRRTIDINLTGVFLTCKYGLQAMLRTQAEDKALILTVSPTSITGMAPGLDAYSTSKAGVLGLMRVMAHDYAREGIRVNGVMPGFIATQMNDEVLADPQKLAEANALIPMRRPGQPAEIAAMMAWVASSQASYACGGVFTVDGGMTAI